MNGRDDIKQYDDPLMGPAQRSRPAAAARKAAPPPDNRSKIWGIIAAVVLVIALSTLGYYIFQSQQRLEQLSASLQTSQEQLGTVSEDLQTSRGEIVELHEGLEKSQSQLGAQGNELGRYKRLYSNLRDDQAEQNEELKAIAVQKADQEEVVALQQKAAGLESGLGDVSTRLDETSGEVGVLREVADANREGIDENRNSLGTLQTTVDSNTTEITGVKRSLDRDYYNFELQKKGGVMKVFNVSLQLKDTDFKRQRYHVEIVADGKRMSKKRVNINEPIFFYIEGVKKPYEILVNRVDKQFVVGYLSVPKI